ncbi:hypothetical protein HPB49_020213 [Dermacentor silvarum]|uniref:Uncharacterized protein n=1 Tax=Dermacentor silvarum TaxID=543639 RepID=A0ACB8DQL6_DERSI|nr:hypothetical protein HPB49_020213 [Dermacentor silvarum]
MYGFDYIWATTPKQCCAPHCFGVVRRCDMLPFLDCLNSVHPSIQFMLEKEDNSRIEFLDVRVEHTATGFDKSVCRKPMHTGRSLSFNSLQLMGHKHSVAASLFNQAFRLYREKGSQKKELHTSCRHRFTPVNFCGHISPDILLCLAEGQRNDGANTLQLYLAINLTAAGELPGFMLQE